MTSNDEAVGRGSESESEAMVWLISSMAGVLASGVGLTGWALGGVAARDATGLVATVVGGVLAGVLVGRSRWLIAAWLAASAPPVLIATFVLPDSTYRYRELVQIVAASIGVCQGMVVAIGSVVGFAFGRRLRLGPARSTAAVALLSLAAGVSTAGWLWFAAGLWPKH
jgi:hypothetical protein